MKNDFESFGAHIRNLLGPYANLVEIVKELSSSQTTEKTKNKLFQFLVDDDHVNNLIENLNEFIEFSHNNKLEKLNFRNQ